MAGSDSSDDNEVGGSGVGGDDAEELLERRRLALEAQLASIEADAISAAGGIGFGKRIGEGTNIAVERLVEVARHDRLLAELKTVLRALDKQSAESAVVCDDCGVEIPVERLEAIPWAVKCVDCAAR